ncbi:MAG: aldehyde ferredoxin oxidoreductase family protein [Proteobacteria bacterium]|nr:aldehyde ferredoxin oxidoreductase family protein [Pseudomonadota bacterium]
MYGNHGKILQVDLSTGNIRQSEFDENFTRKFMGGNGFVAKLIYDHVPPDADPAGEGNAVAIAVGPLTDTPMWGTSRGHMGFISPQTHLFADSNFGGDFPVAQKRTGFDAILIAGKAARPLYLLVTDAGAELRDAAHVWGKTTEETIGILEKEGGKGAVCAAIGPAGERGICFANVICGGKRPGAAGRGGQGAVMGSKNLKAIVVRGGKKTAIADVEGLKAFLKEKLPELKQNKGAMTTFGTGALPNMMNAKGLLGTRNNSRETFEHWQDISADFFFPKYGKAKTACHGCVLACGKTVTVGEGDFKGKVVKMPEYETLFSMGSMLDNPDINAIFNGNHVCDLMGMDTISLGITLSFVAECLEKGVVTEADLGGRVDFADGPGMVELVKLTARREGIGRRLALGSARLCEQFGKDAYKYLHTVKGLEVAGHSPRGIREMSLGYAVSTRGGSHHDTRPFYAGTHPDPGFETRPEYVQKSNYFTTLGDSLSICRFIAEGMLEPPRVSGSMVKVVNFVTGWGIDVEGLERIGERIYTLERLINCRRGVRRKDDVLPWRVMHEPIPDGPSQGRYCPPEELERMLDRYYALRGWSPDGVPTPEKLSELGLP